MLLERLEHRESAERLEHRESAEWLDLLDLLDPPALLDLPASRDVQERCHPLATLCQRPRVKRSTSGPSAERILVPDVRFT